MKIYNLSVLVEPKELRDETDIMQEICQRIQKDGQETIIHWVGGKAAHDVIKKANIASFPNCLTEQTNRLAFAISLPTKKDLGRRWFLKRLEGNEHKTFLLVATSDVSIIHIELD